MERDGKKMEEKKRKENSSVRKGEKEMAWCS